ncbi:MAG: hypothetical protein IT329_15965 [Caldilineaceae bacterium]|nr:hypothetical protein [Caldilineaceae bacterium]
MAASTSDQVYFEDCPSLRWQVTPAEARKLPVHNWFTYPHSFSPGLVSALTRRFGLKPGTRILDPFVGAGTTLLCARDAGFSGVGIDLLPISVALAKAKVAYYDVESLKNDIGVIEGALERDRYTQEVPQERRAERSDLACLAEDENRILAKAFDESTRKCLMLLRNIIDTVCLSEDNHRFCLIGLLALLEEFSATRKSGGWLKLVEPTRRSEELPVSYIARLHRMVADVSLVQSTPHHGEWTATLGDARYLPAEIGFADAVITSPPYLNRHDYTRVLGLELLVGFLSDYAQLRDLRYSLLRSHVEAKPVVSPIEYKEPEYVASILERLSAQETDKRVLRTIKGYFEDMYAVLRSVRGRLADGAWVAFVLGNVRFGGIAIEVDKIVAELGQAVGLKPDRILVARRRNNSAQQMREFGRDPARESVVIWRAE